jgi:hypothetical protein
MYEGELRSNGDPYHKQDLRRAFHPQLKRLWELEPLASIADYVAIPPKVDSRGHKELSLLEVQGEFTFAPLISERLSLAAQIKITLLRPEKPGQIIQQMGDIDNRLKTVFDALCVPPHLNQIPDKDVPEEGETPFYCLLQDDGLITNVSVDTQRLLVPVPDDNKSMLHVVMLVRVKTQVTRPIMAALQFL